MSSRPSPLKSPVPATCQLGRRQWCRRWRVADEAAVGLAEPVGDRARIVAPQDVVAAVAVEVAGAGDVPAGRDVAPAVGVIAGEAAIGLAEPLADGAAVVAPQDVVAPVAVEIAGAASRSSAAPPGASAARRPPPPLTRRSVRPETRPRSASRRCRSALRAAQREGEARQIGVAEDDPVPGRRSREMVSPFNLGIVSLKRSRPRLRSACRFRCPRSACRRRCRRQACRYRRCREDVVGGVADHRVLACRRRSHSR